MGKQLHILVVPLPLQGHITPLVEFSHRLIDHVVKVTFVTIESVHKVLISTLPDQRDEQKEGTIDYISIPDVVDLGNDNKHLRNPFAAILGNISVHVEKLINRINDSGNEKIDCVVADATNGQTLEVAAKFGIQTAAFWPASLGVLAFMLHFPKLIEAGVLDDNGNPTKEEIIKLPSSMPAMSRVDLMWSNPHTKAIMFTFIENVNRSAKVAKFMLCNSFDELEPASLDFIPNIVTVGPLLATERHGHSSGELLPEDSTCLAWLDQQPGQSVTYIAFGSTTVFNQNQFDELVQGLELLGGPFLWVLRPNLTAELSTPYLGSLKERLAHRGKIVDWAPQKAVLAHPAIACFITHCGWNSIMEGVSNGVPLICWPFVADQFPNQNYVCGIWKVGLKFDKDENGVITGSEIKNKVHELLEDEGIRSRANNLEDLAKRSIGENGSSSKNFEDFISALTC